MNSSARVRSSQAVYQNQWLEIRAKYGTGFDEPHYAVSTPDYATILAITEDQHVLFVRQFRPAPEISTIELPSGHVDEGEAPEAAAFRELREETGYEALELISMGSLRPDTGRMSNRLWIFLAKARLVAAPEDGIELLVRPLTSLKQMIVTGELEHALDLAVLTKAAAFGHLRL